MVPPKGPFPTDMIADDAKGSYSGGDGGVFTGGGRVKKWLICGMWIIVLWA